MNISGAMGSVKAFAPCCEARLVTSASILRGLNKKFYHQTVTTKQVENYISEQSKTDFSKFFDQYLRTTTIPVLEYKISGHIVSYRLDSIVNGLLLPLKISFGKAGGAEQWINTSANWQSIALGDWYDGNTFLLNPNFYVRLKKVE
jgi:aminopeptidase N